MNIFFRFYNFALAVWKILYVFSKLQRPVELILTEPAILVQVEDAHHSPDLLVVEVDSYNEGTSHLVFCWPYWSQMMLLTQLGQCKITWLSRSYDVGRLAKWIWQKVFINLEIMWPWTPSSPRLIWSRRCPCRWTLPPSCRDGLKYASQVQWIWGETRGQWPCRTCGEQGNRR